MQAGIDTTVRQLSVSDDPATALNERARPTRRWSTSTTSPSPGATATVRRWADGSDARHPGDPRTTTGSTARASGCRPRPHALLRFGQAELHLRHRLPGLAAAWQPAGTTATRQRASPIRYLNTSPTEQSPGPTTGTTWRPSTGPRICPSPPSGRWRSTWRSRTSRTARQQLRSTPRASSTPAIPFGGFIIGPLDFLFDFDNFPLDDELIDNFRTTPGPDHAGRREQLLAVQPGGRLRNDAYGLYGKYRELRQHAGSGSAASASRAVPPVARRLAHQPLQGKPATSARPSWTGSSTATTGSSWAASSPGTRSTTTPHSLTEPVLLRRVHEKPIRWNGFLEDRLDLGDVVVVGGLRYDYYDTRASRPYALDTWATVPDPGSQLPAYLTDPTATAPAVRSGQPDRAVRAGREPRLPEPARPGVLPGDRPDQLPALLRAPGAGAGLRR